MEGNGREWKGTEGNGREWKEIDVVSQVDSEMEKDTKRRRTLR